jgi:hypothetical protein
MNSVGPRRGRERRVLSEWRRGHPPHKDPTLCLSFLWLL